MERKALVLDANILIRAVLGLRVEARWRSRKTLAALKAMAGLATIVDDDLYGDFESPRPTRSGRLADSGSRPGSRLSDLDGGYRPSGSIDIFLAQ